MIPELVKTDTHTVIFLDEFAEVINKLNRQSLQQDAVDILHTLRAMRRKEFPSIHNSICRIHWARICNKNARPP